VSSLSKRQRRRPSARVSRRAGAGSLPRRPRWGRVVGRRPCWARGARGRRGAVAHLPEHREEVLPGVAREAGEGRAEAFLRVDGAVAREASVGDESHGLRGSARRRSRGARPRRPVRGCARGTRWDRRRCAPRRAPGRGRRRGRASRGALLHARAQVGDQRALEELPEGLREGGVFGFGSACHGGTFRGRRGRRCRQPAYDLLRAHIRRGP
jgi:hypothetical protein